MKAALFAVALVAMTMGVGCSQQDRRMADRDNSAVNERDRSSASKTPIDQNENEFDIKITAAVRKRIMDADVSLNARNVKIITQDGNVTLRGPVKSEGEKDIIEQIAKDVAGKAKVDSQLEVEARP
jgi:hyperosmotically inducible protein